MEPETIVVYINAIVASAVLTFIIWDHFKDNRQLTRHIQEFYKDIETLIFTSIQIKYYGALEKKAIEKKELETKEKQEGINLAQLTNYNDRDIIQNSYIKIKIKQNFKGCNLTICHVINDENLRLLANYRQFNVDALYEF